MLYKLGEINDLFRYEFFSGPNLLNIINISWSISSAFYVFYTK